MSNEKGNSEKIPERQLAALRYRQAGMSYRAIGRALGVSHVTAWQDVSAVIKRLNEDNLEEGAKVKAMELSRLDDALRAIYPAVLEGDLPAIDRMVKIMERRARYEGLDAPVKQAIEHSTPEPINFVLNKVE